MRPFVYSLHANKLKEAFLSIAGRNRKNRSDLYQKRHEIGMVRTTDRDASVSAHYMTVPDHIRECFNGVIPSEESHIISFGVGDCSANLFKPSFDITKETPLFYFNKEPIFEKKYYGLVVSIKENSTIRCSIEKISFKNEQDVIIENIEGRLLWLFCSTPLVYRSNPVSNYHLLINNYDLRHIFSDSKKNIAFELYSTFLNKEYKAFEKLAETKLRTTDLDEVEWYHAGIGIKEDSLLIIHQLCSLQQFINTFMQYEVTDAILLDSGGSSFIWDSSYPNGFVANSNFFRPLRGAIAILSFPKTYYAGIE